jgi:hypothetical protein
MPCSIHSAVAALDDLIEADGRFQSGLLMISS